jgi:hypothetical protein
MIAVMAVLIVFLLVTSGCTSIPGPEPRTTIAPIKTTVPVTPQVKITVAPTPQPSRVAVTTPTMVQMTPPRSSPGMFESRTCVQQGGGIAVAGQQCPGAWLLSTDSFSCCSVPPVRDPVLNTSVVIEPFGIAILLDDDPGSIQP